MKLGDNVLTAIGLMSGTSLDGVDAAIVYTDGEFFVEHGPAITLDYSQDFQSALRTVLGNRSIDSLVKRLSYKLTEYHGEAVNKLLKNSGINSNKIDVIGFHGQTISHDAIDGHTLQIGNPSQLAAITGIDVVNDMRSADMRAGGQGAPLSPLYHLACSQTMALPIAILNIGGVSNVTWIGRDNSIIAFDTGPGNAIINDWVNQRLGFPFDRNGDLGWSGTADKAVVNSVMDHPYFVLKPPKSLDRSDFGVNLIPVSSTTVNGAATAVELIVQAIGYGQKHFPILPLRWLVTGGGRYNLAIMNRLNKIIDAPIEPVEKVGWRGDFLEAEAFGYLAVRSLRGLPLSLPTTTGCSRAVSGGVLTKAPQI